MNSKLTEVLARLAEANETISKLDSEIKTTAFAHLLPYIFDQPNPSNETKSTAGTGRAALPILSGNKGAKEIAGIALIEGENFKLTARDIKASSALDAAVRIALVTIRAYCLLTGESFASSRRVVTPQLKNWRVYDGNGRGAISKYKGIVRTGDNLALDTFAVQDADKFITEINDAAVQGTWRPPSSGKKKREPST